MYSEGDPVDAVYMIKTGEFKFFKEHVVSFTRGVTLNDLVGSTLDKP